MKDIYYDDDPEPLTFLTFEEYEKYEKEGHRKKRR